MNATLLICIVLALIAHTKPFVIKSSSNLFPKRYEQKIKEDLQNDMNLNDNFLDLRVETEVSKRSEFWHKFMKRSQEYSRDLNRLNKKDLKSMLKLKGKLTRVSDGIRFLAN